MSGRRTVGLTLAVLTLGVAACGADADHDGFRAKVDCNDADPAVFPGAPEHCDGVDEDCDGAVDAGAVDAAFAWADTDGDGFGDPGAPILGCEAASGLADNPADCADADADRHPGAAEVCDGLDQDCDGLVDDGATDFVTVYLDADGDGFGDDAASMLVCTPPPGTAPSAGDCDDHDDTSFPGAPERCDAVDHDCDGDPIDGAVDPPTWYADLDSDGFGDPDAPTSACAAPADSVGDAADCDDARADVHPGAVEVCDLADQDCDGEADDAAIDATLYFVDLDGDGFGGTSGAILACSPPSGTADNFADCDDGDPDRSPAATEACGNGTDDDCSGVADDCVLDGEVSASEADRTLDGPSTEAGHVGTNVASGGDLDGDGQDDVFVGELRESSGAYGAAWIAWGVPTSGDLDAEAVRIDGPTTDADLFGSRVAVVGDLDGDGFADAMTAAPRDDLGVVHLLYGDATRAVAGSVTTWPVRIDGVGLAPQHTFGVSQLGDSLSGVGDLDGDGLPEAAFAAPFDGDFAGRAFVLPGDAARSSGTVHAMDLPQLVGLDGGYLGADDGIAGGDLDGDGLSDLAVGANEGGADGRVFVLYGTGSLPASPVDVATLPSIGENQGALTYFGRQVRCPGDLDGDGYGDLEIGDPWDATVGAQGGSAWVFAGDAAPLVGIVDVSTAHLHVTATTAYAHTGMSAASADLDGDGSIELLVGSTDDNTGAEGEVGVFDARTGTVPSDDADLRFVGDIGWSLFGSSVATGDVDGDGLPDVLVGAAGYGSYDGRVYLFLGASL